MRISIDFNPKLIEKIDKLAKDQKRTRKAQIEFMIEFVIENLITKDVELKTNAKDISII